MSANACDHKVALFLANGCETIEALTVADILYRAGIPCTKVSVNSTPVFVTSHNVTVVADTTVDHLDWDSYDMLVLPGGIPGTPNLKACTPLMEQVARFHRSGKMIAAITGTWKTDTISNAISNAKADTDTDADSCTGFLARE